MFLVVNAPAMGILWSYVDMSGRFIPLPADLSRITPFLASGLARGTYPLFTGPVPRGTYELYIGCDFKRNGHLDIAGGVLDGIYDYMTVRVL